MAKFSITILFILFLITFAASFSALGAAVGITIYKNMPAQDEKCILVVHVDDGQVNWVCNGTQNKKNVKGTR